MFACAPALLVVGSSSLNFVRAVPWYQRSLETQVWILFTIGLLAGVSQLLHFKAIYRSIRIYQVPRAPRSALIVPPSLHQAPFFCLSADGEARKHESR
jgi:hypothetical protein